MGSVSHEFRQPTLENLQLSRSSIPFVGSILQLAQNEQISIPTIEYAFLGKELFATQNYLLTQMVRHNSRDETGILAPLIGNTTDPENVAFYANNAASRAFNLLEVFKGDKATTHMLSFLFEQAPPTIEDLINLDMAWGITVQQLKVASTPQGDAFRERNLQALKKLATERTNGNIANLTQRLCETGGAGEGRLTDVTEALLLPVIAMPELDSLVPPSLRRGSGTPEASKADTFRFIREAGKIGNDLTRAILESIKESEKYKAGRGH